MAEDARNGQLGPEVDHRSEEGITISPLAVMNAVFRHKGLIASAGGVGIGLALAGVLLQTPRYQAVVKFVSNPGTARTVGGVGGDLGLIQQRDPFDYYTSVLASTDVLNAVLSARRPSGGLITDGLGLADAGVDQTAARLVLSGAGVQLDASTRARVANVFPVLLVKATWTDPGMAADLANAFVAALADYDRRIRSSSARERREFVELQTTETARRLAAAEDALRMFRERNRLLLGANGPAGASGVPVPPQLELRRDQLQREVTVQTELYLSLKRAFDQVRIAELDAAPSLVVVEPASPPRSRMGTSRRTVVLAGGVFGLVCGLVLALLVELRQRLDLTSPEGQEFVGHLETMRQQAATLTLRVKGPSPPSSTIKENAPGADA